MKTFHMIEGETLTFLVDFASLENARDGADSDWLNRSTSPAEQIDRHSITVPSPTSVNISSDSLVDSVNYVGNKTGVEFTATAARPGTTIIQINAVSTSSPEQRKVVKVKFKVTDA